MAVTPNFGWNYPTVDGDADVWGDILNTALSEIDVDLKAVKDVADAAAAETTINAFMLSFVGKEGRFYTANAPAGWVKANGGTIGNAASGATTRANADVENLFVHLWSGLTDNTLYPIQDSSGSATTRGASAAADYAANKRFPLPDRRGEGDRGWDDGRGVDSGRALGSGQLDAMQGHFHGLANGVREVSPPNTNGFSGTTGLGNTLSQTEGPEGDGTHGTPRIASETRMRNVAALVCIKL